jgi:hypothetical protein
LNQMFFGHLDYLTSSHFFFFFYFLSKDSVYVPLLPITLLELAMKKQTATVAFTPAMLTNVSSELQYRRDTYRAIRDAVIKFCKLLNLRNKNLSYDVTYV